MTDKELLEAAARAAGLPTFASGATGLRVASDGCKSGYIWNPLTDDGDALRLAVKLGLVVDAGAHKAGDGMGVWFAQVGDRDHNAATRRAIVRAAAEIGNAATTKTKAAGEISLTSRQE